MHSILKILILILVFNYTKAQWCINIPGIPFPQSIGAGTYSQTLVNADMSQCSTECYFISMPFYGVWKGLYCFCFNSLAGTTNISNTANCTGWDGLIVSASSSSNIITVFDTSMTSLQISTSTTVPISMGPNVYNITPSGSIVAYNYSYADRPGAWEFSSDLSPIQRIIYAPGVYEIRIESVKPNVLSKISEINTQFLVYQTITNLTLTCQPLALVYVLANCTLTLNTGSRVSGTILVDGTVIDNLGLSDAPWERAGPVPNFFGNNFLTGLSLAGINIGNAIFEYSGTISYIEFNARLAVSIDILLLKPNCAQYYCFANSACSTSAVCSRQMLCASDYCSTSLSCTTSCNNRLLKTENITSLPVDYVIAQKSTITIPIVGYQVMSLGAQWPVEPGYRLAIHSQTQADVIATTVVRSDETTNFYYSFHTTAVGTVLAATSFTPVYATLQLAAVSQPTRNIKFKMMFNVTGLRNVTVSLNTVDNVQVTSTFSVQVGLVINDTSLFFPSFATTNQPYTFRMNPHTGDMLQYYYVFGDTTTMNTTSGIQNHTYTQSGTYNSTIYAFNMVTSKVQYTTIYVQDPVIINYFNGTSVTNAYVTINFILVMTSGSSFFCTMSSPGLSNVTQPGTNLSFTAFWIADGFYTVSMYCFNNVSSNTQIWMQPIMSNISGLAFITLGGPVNELTQIPFKWLSGSNITFQFMMNNVTYGTIVNTTTMTGFGGNFTITAAGPATGVIRATNLISDLILVANLTYNLRISGLQLTTQSLYSAFGSPQTFNIIIANGSGVQCIIYFGDGNNQTYNTSTYYPWFNNVTIQYTYQSVATFNATIVCSNIVNALNAYVLVYVITTLGNYSLIPNNLFFKINDVLMISLNRTNGYPASLSNATINWQDGQTAFVGIPAFNESAVYTHQFLSNGAYNVTITLQNPLSMVVKSVVISIITPVLNFRCTNIPLNTWNGNLMTINTLTDAGQFVVYTFNSGDGTTLPNIVLNVTALNTLTSFNYTYNTVGSFSYNAWACNQIGCLNCTNLVQIQYKVKSTDFQVVTNGNIEFLKTLSTATVSFSGSVFPTSLSITYQFSDGSSPTTLLLTSSMMPYTISYNVTVTGFGNVSITLANLASSANYSTPYGVFQKFVNFNMTITWGSTNALGFGSNLNTYPLNQLLNFRPTSVGTAVGYIFMYIPQNNLSAVFQCNATIINGVFSFPFTAVGTYNLSMKVYNPIDFAYAQAVVIIGGSILGTQINTNPLTLLPNYFGYVYITWAIIDPTCCICVDYGNGTKLVYGALSGCNNCTGYAYTGVQPVNSQLKPVVQYAKESDYNIVVFIYNNFQSVTVNKTIPVTYAKCSPPVVSMTYTNFMNAFSPQTAMRSSQIMISGLIVDLPCSMTSNNVKAWSLVMIDSSLLTPILTINLTSITTKNNTQLILPPRFLSYGLYLFTFSVVMDKTVTVFTFQSSSQTYLQVGPSPIIVSLSSGGITLINQGVQQNICFTPQIYSQDPDLNVQTFANWTWQWSCQQSTETLNTSVTVVPKPQNYVFPPPKSGCFGDGPGMVNFTSSTCFYGGNLDAGLTYIVGLIATTPDKRTGSSKIVINAVNGIPPNISIQCLRPQMCIINQNGKYAFNEVVFNPSDPLLLSATCVTAAGVICAQGIWSMILFDEPSQSWIPMNPTLSNTYLGGYNSLQTVLYPQFFIDYASTRRLQTCYSSTTTGSAGQACIQFYMFPLPSGILCTISNTNVLQTDNVCVNCNFQPNFQYRFYVNVSGQPTTLGFNATGQFCSLIPYQKVAQTYIVRVTNTNGGYIDITVETVVVQLLSPTSINTILTNLQKGTDNTLKLATAKGDFQSMSQVYTQYSSLITASNQNIMLDLTNVSTSLGGTGYTSTNVGPSTRTISSLSVSQQVIYETNRDKMSGLINIMTSGLYSMIPGDIQSLNLISSVVKTISNSFDCINRQSQWDLSTNLLSLANNLKKMQSSATRNDITTIATNLLSAVFQSDAAANIQIKSGIIRDIQDAKMNFLDYDVNIESPSQSYMTLSDPNAASNMLTLETNSNFQSKIATGCGTNSQSSILIISKVMRDSIVLNDMPVSILTSHLQYYLVKSVASSFSNQVYNKGRSTINLPDICLAMKLPGSSCSDPNNPISLEVIATPNNVRAYMPNPNGAGLPIPMGGDLVTLNMFTGSQTTEMQSHPQTSTGQSFAIFLARDPIYSIPPFNMSETAPQIAAPQFIPGTGTPISGPLCFEQKLFMYTFNLTGSDQSVHFQIASNFSVNCTQYLVVGRLGQNPVLTNSPDGTVDPINFTFWGMIPTDIKYCNMAADSNTPDPFTFFINNNQFNQAKAATLKALPNYSKTLNTIYYGVRELLPVEYNSYTPANRPPVPYTFSAQINHTFRVRIFSTGCYSNSDSFTGAWRTAGCVVGPLTTTQRTQCLCTHLTSFAGGWVVAPNTIDFNYVFSNFDFTKNLTLFVTEITLILIFILIFVWARRQDIKDIEKIGVTPLASNDSNDMYLYEIIVDTSIRGNAGTNSNVYFILSGELDETDSRHLVDSKRPILKRGNVDRFLLAVPRTLGTLQYIRLWHDNSGKGPNASWYCNYFGVTDLQTKEKYHFLVNNWFAVEEDNGQIDRLIAVASEDELLIFGEVFSRKMKHNLSEDHLWLSIMARPPESRFTRVERVACCLLLLFLTMLTTCMFYQTEGPSASTTNVLKVGPFAITPREVWTGLISNMIAFVPLFVIIELFRRSQLKHGHANKLRQAVEGHLQIAVEPTANKGYQGSTATLIRNENMDISRPNTPGFRSTEQINVQIVDQENENNLDSEDKLKKPVKRKRLFPWWTRIFVWAFLSFLMIVALLFTTLYGIQFGDLACKKWISSMFISFFTSILLTQPIKVILIAMFVSLICKKSSSFGNSEYIDDEEELMNELGKRSILMQNEEYLHNDLYTGPVKPHRSVVQPPPKEELEKARELRLKELQMFDVFREIMFYVIFFCTLIFVTYSLRDPNSFQLKSSIVQTFVNPANPNVQYTQINQPSQFWSWALNVLVPGLRAPVWYNNQPQLYQRGFLSDRNNRLIGYAILRQVRTPKNSCKVNNYVKNIVNQCYSGYNMFKEDTGSYGAMWTDPSINGTANGFTYSTMSDLKGMIYIGRIGVYNGGGYVYQFRSNVSNLYNDIVSLQNNNWIDVQTRAVFVEFTTYNPNINLFAINTFVLEFPGSGGCWPIYRSEPANLLGLYSGGVKALEIFCQILYGIFILIIIVKEIRNFMKQKAKYFLQFWNLCEIFIIFGSFASVGGFVYVTIATGELTSQFNKYGGDVYLNFSNVAFWNENLGYLVSLIVFVATLKFLRLLRFNKRVGMLGSVLNYSGKDMRQFFIIFAIMFLAFVMVFYSLFMDSLYRYHTFLFATEASMQIALGKFAFLELYQKEPIFGPIVFAGYVLFIIFVLLNMFVAILYEAYGVVKADIDLQGNDFEMVNFIMTKFIMWTGISNTKLGKRLIKTGVTDQIYKDIDSRQLTDKVNSFPIKVEQLLNHINRIIHDGGKGDRYSDKSFSNLLFDKNKSSDDLNDNYEYSRPASASSNILKSRSKPQMTPLDK